MSPIPPRPPVTPLDWVLGQLWSPIVRALDLVDRQGEHDHGKIIGLLFAGAILGILVWTDGRVPSLGHTIALLAAAFGSRVFIAFLRSRTVTSQETVQTVREITERRALLGDAEATP